MNPASLLFMLGAVLPHFLLPGVSHSNPAKAGISAQPPRNLVLEIEGKIYPKDTFPAGCAGILDGVKCEAEAFGRFHVESSKEGELIHHRVVFSAPDGPQVLEDSWERDGHVIKARIENRALGKVSELEVKDKKVHYKTTDKDGDVDTSVDDHEEHLVVPSTIMSYIRPHFDKIKAGEKVRIKVAVLDRRESYTFNIKKHKDAKGPTGEEILVLEMSPGSLFVKALVSSMYFYIYPKTGEMFAFDGRSALRRKEGNSYKELDVKVAYEYKVNVYNLLNKASARNDAPHAPGCSAGELLGTGKDAKCEVKSQ